MKKFKFRLEVLLDMRKRREEKIMLEFADQNRLILDEHKKLIELNNELKLLQQGEKDRRSTENCIVSLRYSVAYRFKLKQDMIRVGKHIDELKENLFRIQKKLTIATRDRKAVELLKEHRHQEWKKEFRSMEQDFIDDISQKKQFKRQAGV
jgi:flagellar FliJ protein